MNAIRLAPSALIALDLTIAVLTQLDMALEPTGQIRRAVADRMGEVAAGHASTIVPWWTGELSRAQTHEPTAPGNSRVFIDPSNRNPITGDPPAVYGREVHQRKPFYDQTAELAGLQIFQAGEEELWRQIEVIWT